MGQLSSLNIDKNPDFFWKLGLKTIQELETEAGILASSSQEIYGCIFGRDSLITALKLLRAYEAGKPGNTTFDTVKSKYVIAEKNDDQEPNAGLIAESNADIPGKQPYFLGMVKKILSTLIALQGQQVNIESGEEPGKCIHEFRTSHHEHLTNHPQRPWYLYPDKIMRNFDSVDATPLLLIAIYRYWQKSGDQEFLTKFLPNVESALKWLLESGDTNGDGFIDYRPHPDRKFGGLITQNWMDSAESAFHENGEEVVFPVAPVEVQGYCYLAMQMWALYFADKNSALAETLKQKARNLKISFNKRFILKLGREFSLACALDGLGRPLTSPRSSMGHVLWASLNETDDGVRDSVLNEEFIKPLAERLLQPDLFEKAAGIRTLSSASTKFEANSYHNGSIWPHDNSLIAEGMELWGFKDEAVKIRKAIFLALVHFGTPIELYVYDHGQYSEYCSPTGQRACKKQAWSAASLLTASLSLQQKTEN